MQCKTIVVTGSNGFIGSQVVAQLIKNPLFQVIGLGKGECRLNAHIRFEYYEVDLISESQITHFFSLHNPDSLVHCAAISQVDLCEDNEQLCKSVNVTATEVLVRESEKCNAQFIFLSSDFVFDGTKKWISEESKPNPISAYGKSKLAAEEVVKASKLEWAIIRPVLVYGFSSSASRGNIFTWIVESLKQEKKIQVVNDQIRTPTFVGDVVKLIVGIIHKPISGVFNIGGEEAISVYNFACLISKQKGISDVIINPVNSSALNGAELRPKNSCFTSEKVKQLYSICPIKPINGINESIRQMDQF